VSTLSIIIRTLNEARHLGEVLACIHAQEIAGHGREIVIVDSGSADRTAQIAQEYGCRMAHIDRAEFTFGRSLNLGCATARGQILVFVSGHCVPRDRRWLANLVAPLISGAAQYSYGRQTGRDTTKFSEQQVFEKYFPAQSRLSGDDIFCNNANAAVLRSAWEAIRFDERLTGLEDMKFAKDLIRSGGKIAYAADAVVYHIHDESWRQVRLRYEREALALRDVMPEVHFGLLDFLRYFFGGVLHDVRRAASMRLLRRHVVEIVLFRFMQFFGVYLGNQEHRRLSARQKDEYFYPKTKRTPFDEQEADGTAAPEGSQRARAGEELPPAGR
jgi:glycosyltransferase involved in cell wall biosynthesis